MKCYVIDPLVMIGNLKLVSHVVTTYLVCYESDLLIEYIFLLNWIVLFKTAVRLLFVPFMLKLVLIMITTLDAILPAKGIG